ncbi:MAG: hypothetical protein HZA16_03020 [Nitrospirae bacterium]|nr:hypothetical protein [Nitrospirota bacterium]
MKALALITVLLFLAGTSESWSGTRERESYRRNGNSAVSGIDAAAGKQDLISGLMTKISKVSVVIGGKEYGLSPDTHMSYQGLTISDFSFFKAMKSAEVTARIEDGVVKELVIVKLNLRA